MLDPYPFDYVRQRLSPFALRTPPRSALSRLDLPAASAKFLDIVGLPTATIPPGLDFNLVETLPRPHEVFPRDKFDFAAGWEQAFMLRERHGIGMYVNLLDGASVWELDPDRPAESCFVNSSVELLGYFLAESNEWPLSENDGSESSNLRSLQQLENRLRAADPDAFDAAGSTFWSLVFEDAGYYLG